MLSRDVAQRLDTQIRLAGDYLGLTPEEYVGLSIMSAAGGGVLGMLIGASTGNPALLAIACFALGGALPYLQISEQAQRRLKDVDRGLPHAIDLIALGMSAGLDFPGAVRQVVERSSRPNDPIVEELTRLLQELQLGRTRMQVLEELGKRAPTQSVTELVSALVQAEDKGNPVADVIQTQAAVSRARRTVRAEEQASKASVMMVGPLFLLFACIMLLVLGPMVLTLASQDL
ncbi:type II secretion system F family protein [Sorangium sp. So ce1128]